MGIPLSCQLVSSFFVVVLVSLNFFSLSSSFFFPLIFGLLKTFSFFSSLFVCSEDELSLIDCSSIFSAFRKSIPAAIYTCLCKAHKCTCMFAVLDSYLLCLNECVVVCQHIIKLMMFVL